MNANYNPDDYSDSDLDSDTEEDNVGEFDDSTTIRTDQQQDILEEDTEQTKIKGKNKEIIVPNPPPSILTINPVFSTYNQFGDYNSNFNTSTFGSYNNNTFGSYNNNKFGNFNNS